MDTTIENAIRSVARCCRKEIIEATDGKPISENDSLITEILDRHAKKITALPPNTFPAKLWLSYYVRQIDKEIRGQL
ncbi:hypothetical protein [Yersinia ruckeri]|uniref:hypothetical protein n=1 Tax=Yersinia ruckeri TaxID=29486 RepID=UPI0008FE3E77|nr:hypothetical protein [Yersinia ruckeri]OJB95752.1 hypothetical protein AXW59_07355 [Yersinia ruckeri]OJB98553.1 hypothetical protein AXW58_07335 [Yersinia ruckeri]OJC00201.1 hypothetical protein AXW57_07350 [Yersinia ruckeri]